VQSEIESALHGAVVTRGRSLVIAMSGREAGSHGLVLIGHGDRVWQGGGNREQR
jgi:hypothetical protein